MLQLGTPAGPKSSGSPVLDEQGLAVAMRIADGPAADPRLAVPVMPVRSELSGWATNGLQAQYALCGAVGGDGRLQLSTCLSSP
jgi:hypothetical protein